jgi:plasmid maintenance system antidote protein VapI
MRQTMEQIIRQAIEKDGRTAKELAEVSGVDTGILSRFLGAKRTMTLPTADKVCRALGLELRSIRRKGG